MYTIEMLRASFSDPELTYAVRSDHAFRSRQRMTVKSAESAGRRHVDTPLRHRKPTRAIFAKRGKPKKEKPMTP